MSDDEPPHLETRGEWLGRVFPSLGEPLLSETASRLTLVRCSAGEAIVQQGDPADALYIVIRGRVNVARADQSGRLTPIATLGVGQFFGEMALLAGAPRNATVSADTDVDLLRLDREAFRQVVGKDSTLTRTSLQPGNGEAPLGPAASDQHGWARVVRSACHALVASHRAVHSVDVLGRSIGADDPTTLLRLADLARRTASEYGVEVRVSQVGQRPVLHFTTSPWE